MGLPTSVSVCIPTYNGAEFVAEAVSSVLTQSFVDFELLVVDDGSSDATPEVVRSFADPRIRVYRNDERLGIPKNWNRCLSLACGEYICLFHQDDVMLVENLEQKVRMLASDVAISFVHSAAEVFIEDSAPSPLPSWIEDAAEDFIVEGVAYFRKLLFPGNRVCAPTVMARRQKLVGVGGFDEELGFTSDYEMWMKACVGSRVGFLSRPLIRYRWHGKNASHAYRFAQGAEETLLARRRAVQYYVERTGRQEEGELMQSAILALAEAGRRAAQLDRQSENQLAYIKELEQMRDKLWADVQQVGRGWEEQRAYIENQQAYIKELEQMRDKLWADVQQMGRNWEEQKAYIESQQTYIEGQQARVESQQTHIESLQAYVRQVEQERDWLAAARARMLSQRLKRLARRVWQRAHGG
jgi:hypothetical protein